ncbi:MAG: glycosyltransferase family 2 protein [Acidimicrobiia bacterium]|nr:glycosyltransferase family 2 protein [Acidimicrobiia bacterium]
MSTGGAPPLISVVSPIYLAEDLIDDLTDQVKASVSEITEDFEIVLVDDGSPDDSWRRIEKQCRSDYRVKGVQLSRNFGQHHALTAGLATATGDYVVVMDCDLQDHPRYIPQLYEEITGGYDLVLTRKRARAHGGARNWTGGVYSWIFNVLITDRRLRDHKGIGNYSILSRRVVDSFLSMNDRHRHYLGLIRWMGFNAGVIEIDHHERPKGSTSYTFRRLLREAMVGITSETERLLQLSVVGGFVFVGLAAVLAVTLVVLWATVGFLRGWTSLMVVNLLGIGLVLSSLGVAGIYLGNIFEQTKQRPLYLIREELNTRPSATETDDE